jgi:putative SOS response-associated peptidase YedK
MCGRYRRKSDKQRIADAFKVTAGLAELDLGSDDDIAPGSIQPVVSINHEGERQLELMRWGFKLHDRLLFNARSEGIETSKFWRDAFIKGRVIVPADAIFEWKEMPKGQKKPKYEFTLTGQEPFGMAGLWKLWKNPKTDLWERTFAVITGEPNERMRTIHDRMTAFLEFRDFEEYLATSERPPFHLLRILPSEKMKVTLVGETPATNTKSVSSILNESCHGVELKRAPRSNT